MIGPSCLQKPPPPVSDMLLSDGLFELTAGLLLIALALAAAVAPYVRRRYRQRVIRLMGMDQVAPRPAGWWTSVGSAAAAHASPPSPTGGADAGGAGDLASRARQRDHRITVATVVAWLAFATMAWWVAGIAAGVSRGGRLGFAGAAALLALGPAMTNLPPRWTRRALTIGFFACVLGMLLMNNLDSGAATVAAGASDEDLPAWQMALGALLTGGAYLAMCHRSLRGQVLPVFVVLGVAMLLTLVPYGYLERHAGSCLAEIDATGEGSPQRTAFLLVAAPFIVLCVWLALRTLDALVRLIERGWLSEVSLASAVSLTVVAWALVYSRTPEGADGREAWWAWAPLLWVAATLGVYALALGRRPAGAAGPQLLVLRVFAQDGRKHGLLDEVQSRWRYVGAVHQIGGPDMVAMNVDPYESAMFLGNRLHDLFLPEAASPAQLRARLNTAPDREGRYRINEVFCFNTAWRSTVEQLMRLSEAIVLDLRGLTAQREGTAYEIRRLAGADMLPRVVAVGDDGTDWPHVEALLRAEGQDPRRLVRLDVGKGPQVTSLFTRLLEVAARQGAAAEHAPGGAASA